MPRPILEFWYDFASTYSYLTAMRIEAAAEEAGVGLLWRPFLLGPIFSAQGWTSSPFNLFPGKGRYMWRDMEREAARLNIPFVKPDPFPQNSLLAARVALLGGDAGWTPAFTRAIFTAEFGKGRNIGDPVLLTEILTGLGQDPKAVLSEAESEANKMRLRRMSEEAQSRGIFGAPTFFAEDGEMFWGNDRLERALEWAVARAHRSELPV
ncbi:2-hydroxychromene-2-carboxylate isomerase [Microvirga flavescens]|uniref:2-hydroxychromene-2-carboxylate isomerase n=1 Tax=Microvirga flavescens TaxID=2249811 RepID=UPI000DDB2E01|nr:2-hydroxychromene-2-carboxylate isomerase [Microvirga flavescens]